jgi:hypothetical protein
VRVPVQFALEIDHVQPASEGQVEDEVYELQGGGVPVQGAVVVDQKQLYPFDVQSLEFV